MEFARSTWRLFAANARTAILFEFGFRFLFAILFVPACFGMVDLAMEAAGLAYLADTNMTTLFANPLAWVFLLVATLVLALGALFEMCALVVVMQAGKTGRRIGVFETSRLAFSSARRIARPSNWLLALFVLLLVPLTNLTVTSSALTGVRLPEFIMDFIWENGALTAVFVIVMAALYLHAFFLAFGIHFFTLCDESWMQARISSRSLLRGNAWRLARRLLALFAVFASGAVAAIVVGVLILAAILEGGLPFGVSFALTLVMFAFTIVVDCVFAPLSYAALSATFYEFSQERGIDVPYRIDEPSRTCRTRLARAAVGSFLAMLGLVSLLSYDPLHGVFESESQREPAPDFAITAHRGGAREAPENTLAAFQNAIDQGADWVELDVQQTADGVLMVMHDANLKRTTGLDKEFWQVTYDEIKDLDNGSWFDPAFADQRICTLEEALALCKGKIKLNIEVKPDGHGVDLERKTVDLINAYDMRDQVAVASISYESLAKVKEIDPSMPTMYDMTLAYGSISSIEHVDYFSVDDFFVTQELVDEVQGAGKIIYAWTVNDPANMSRLIDYGIDGLVTDDIAQARELYEAALHEGHEYFDAI